MQAPPFADSGFPIVVARRERLIEKRITIQIRELTWTHCMTARAHLFASFKIANLSHEQTLVSDRVEVILLQ